MKTKLTITVDSEVLPRAKRYARARGVSLSSLVEDALRQLSEGEAPSFSLRWRGNLKAATKDDERFRVLAEKYL